MKTKNRSRFWKLLLAPLCLASLASASSVTIGVDGSGAIDNLFQLTAATNGAGMAGLLSVTVFFAGGGSSTAIWAANCGALCGSASNGTWTLTETGDPGAVTNTNSPNTSQLNAWTLTNTSTTVGIISVSMTAITDATLHSLVFDRDLNSGGAFGTPGSNFGIDYTLKSETGNHDATVTYDNKATLIGGGACAGLPGNVPCGDVWGTLNFQFGTSFIATAPGTPANWIFWQDTDLASAPEPATLAVTGAGLLALIVGLLRKRRAARI